MNRQLSDTLTYDIVSENFDLYFHNLLSGMTEQQRDSVDGKLARKVFKGKTLRVDKLTFPERAYILGSVFKRPLFVLIGNEGDAAEALSPSLFQAAANAYKGKDGAMGELAADVVDNGNFIIGTRELLDHLSMLRLVCATDIYRLVLPLQKRKLKPSANVAEFHAALKYNIRYLSHYEGQKKRMETDYGITLSEWYALLHYYSGEKSGSSFYKEAYLNAVQCNRTTKKKALTRLTMDGYLFRRGKTNKVQYSISPKGQDTVIKIFDRLVFNF